MMRRMPTSEYRKRPEKWSCCLCAVLALWIILVAARAEPQSSNSYVSTTSVACSSQAGERHHCSANTSAGIMLLRSTGSAACLLGNTWGYDDQGVWVLGGCGGEFTVAKMAPESQPEQPDASTPRSSPLSTSNNAQEQIQPTVTLAEKPNHFGSYTSTPGSGWSTLLMEI